MSPLRVMADIKKGKIAHFLPSLPHCALLKGQSDQAKLALVLLLATFVCLDIHFCVRLCS